MTARHAARPADEPLALPLAGQDGEDGDVPPADPQPTDRIIVCPFTIIIDSRESLPYSFAGLRAGADQGHALIEVPTVRMGMPTGDYTILDYPQICIERKTCDDLYSSVVRRDNFEARLERMSEKAYAAVVVEAEWSEIIGHPPAFSKFNPKALARTLIAWSQRYPHVHWWFMPGREAAEALTFRLLERFHLDHREESVVPENGS